MGAGLSYFEGSNFESAQQDMAVDLKPHLQRYGTLLPEEICPVNADLD